jgi:uncharacterized RmlC-like cupin family protein
MSDISGPQAGPIDPTGDPFHRMLHQIRRDALSGQTAQTSGMTRLEAISGKTVGSSKIWMGQTLVAPSTASGNHSHGASETAIYVVSGSPRFVFLQEGEEIVLQTVPGDYIYVPPWVPHREENPDPDQEALVVIARSTQEAIVINLPDLRWAGPVATGTFDLGRLHPGATGGS